MLPRIQAILQTIKKERKKTALANSSIFYKATFSESTILFKGYQNLGLLLEKKIRLPSRRLSYSIWQDFFFFFKDICGGYRFSLLKCFLLSMYSFPP